MANQEAFTLDGLALNDGTVFAIDGQKGVDMAPPADRPEFIGAADSEAQLLTRTPLHENRTITIPMVVLEQATMDLVHDKIALVVDKLQKASKYPDGIALTWTPATGTRTVTFDVLRGRIIALPVDIGNGWMARSPEFAIELTCKPYWRGARVVYGTTATASAPFVTLEVASIPGDVPALGELIVTDTASQSRRHVEWGLEGPLTYNSSTSLLVDSDNMVTSGFAGTQTTFAGAYDPNAAGNSVINAQLYPSPVAVCGTGNLSHVGSFLVKARVLASASTQVRLSWRAGDGPISPNPWATVTPEARWVELDLGTIIVPAALAGTQRWTGQVEALCTAVGAPSVYVDYLELVPTSDGYGKARATYSYSSGVVVAIDQFTSTTATSALAARAAPLGGSWATSGSATDFVFADDLSGEQIKRSTTSDAGPRWGILGSTNYADTQVDVLMYRASGTLAGDLEQGAVARWVDSSNYLRAIASRTSAGVRTFSVVKRVAGVDTTIASTPIVSSWSSGLYFCVRIIAFTSGRVLAWLLDSTQTSILADLETTDSTLATGGVLDDGKPGIYDYAASASSGARYYDNFTVSTPAAEPIALYSGRSLQIRYDDVIRDDSTATYSGRPASYRGSRFLVPVGTSRVLVKARRADIESTFDDNVTDALQIQVAYTPRGLAVPR